MYVHTYMYRHVCGEGTPTQTRRQALICLM